MLPRSWKKSLVRTFGRPARATRRKPAPLSLEALTERIAPAVTASFVSGAGTLSVFGDSLNNTITISRNAAGTIFVNGGAVAVTGGTPTVANTTLVQVFGEDGNDNISLDEANGALPAAHFLPRRVFLGRRGHLAGGVAALGPVVARPVGALAQGDAGQQGPQPALVPPHQHLGPVAEQEALVDRLDHVLGVHLVAQQVAELAARQPDQPAGEAVEGVAGLRGAGARVVGRHEVSSGGQLSPSAAGPEKKLAGIGRRGDWPIVPAAPPCGTVAPHPSSRLHPGGRPRGP